jgi:hypothetical protein
MKKGILLLLICLIWRIQVSQASPAIAVWACTDKLPVAGTATPGVSAYHPTGVSVEFKVDGNSMGTATQEEINPATGYPEYFVEINTTTLSDGDHTLSATATPGSGTAKTLATIILRVENTLSDTEYYLNGSTGNDTNDGKSADKAWRTFSKAETSTGDGDVIHVAEGTYATVSGPVTHTSASKFRKWIGEAGKTVTLKSNTITYFGEYEYLENFTFDGGFQRWSTRAPNGQVKHLVMKDIITTNYGSLYGIASNGGNDCAFTNLDLFDPAAQATYGKVILWSGNQDRIILRGIQANRGEDGFYGNLSNSLVEGWNMRDMRKSHNDPSWHADGFQWNQFGPVSDNVILRSIKYWYTGSVQFNMQTNVTNNFAWINCMVAVDKGPTMFNVDGVNSHLIHCTFLNVGNSASTAYTSGATVVRNSIFTDLKGAGTAENNCYLREGYQAGSNGNFVDAGPHTVKTGISDAEYAAGVVADFSLVQGSACIDASKTGDPVRFDGFNNPRDSKPDIGAVEYGADPVRDFKFQISNGKFQIGPALPNPITQKTINDLRLTINDIRIFNLVGKPVGNDLEPGVYYLETGQTISKFILIK